MLKLLFKYKWYIAIIFALIIIEPSLNSVLNFWLQRMFNAAKPGEDMVVIVRFLTTGFLLWVLKRIIAYASAVLKSRYICNAKQDLKYRVFSNLMGFDTANLSAVASSGEYISLFTNDINLLETRFLNQIISLISGIFSVVILGASFFALNKKLAGAILSFGVIAMFVPLIFSRLLNQKSMFWSEKMSEFTQRIKEYLIAYPTIKNYSIEGIIRNKFRKINTDTEDARFEAEYALNLANNVGQLLSWFMQFIGVGLGLMLVVKGEIVVGTVVAAQSFASDLALPLQNIIMNVNAIYSVRALVKKFDAYSTEKEAFAAPAPAAPSPAPAERGYAQGCEIAFSQVCLNIEDKKIIDNFSFRFEKGKKYLMVGLNGSGKSSLFRILKRWFPKCTGKITVDGVEISSLENRQLSRAVSYMNENVSLFSGTVQENISLFRSYSEDDFNNAIRDAQVRLSLNREISDEGRNISSGEQRRIEIARSLLESVGVLIFDEVVSTLDIETAYEIEKLALGFREKTVIFISHNFSGKLIREYDEILVMGDGKLIAHGSYNELLESCDYFKRICEIKFG